MTEHKKERLNRITTKTGDAGTTALADGSRLPKSAPIFHAIGSIDELNANIGLLISTFEKERSTYSAETYDQLIPILTTVQNRLFDIGSELALAHSQRLDETHISKIESWIETTNEPLPALEEFILPGGTITAAQAQVARTVCRRAER